MGQLIDRFGATGVKGEEGEKFMMSVLKSQGFDVRDYRTDLVVQSQGIDFGINKPSQRREFTLDVKNNLYIKDDYHAFKVEIERFTRAGWFYTSKADFIYHTNAYTGNYIYYNLNELRYYITKQLIEKSASEVFKLVNINGDVLIQFQFSKGMEHNIPVSSLY